MGILNFLLPQVVGLAGAEVTEARGPAEARTAPRKAETSRVCEGTSESVPPVRARGENGVIHSVSAES